MWTVTSVIRIEPRAASAWSVLAQSYADTGQPQKALQLRIMAAHLRHDALHANAVLSQHVLDYAPLFAEIADAYFDKELYADARPIYELLGADAATSSLYVLLQTAAYLRVLDGLKDAAEVYEQG
ncbi:hypothetical protein C0991_001165 [Blastosporella zonata]|nr:hypothetical protein C0991_001165 [Blastosporella zonata]